MELKHVHLNGTGTLPKKILAHFDGLCEPQNPGGVATVAWALTDLEGKILRQYHAVIADGGPGATNNVAEWTAFGVMLRYISDIDYIGEIQVRGDSKLVINQALGNWQRTTTSLHPYQNRCDELMDGLKRAGCRLNLQWVPREQNQVADGLSLEAFMQYAQAYKPHYINMYHMEQKRRAAKKAKQ